MDLHELPSRATNFNFKELNSHILGLVLTFHINLKLSTRQTTHALREVHGINISHITLANYVLTAAAVIKPFVDSFNHKHSTQLSADESNGIRHYIGFVMDAVSKSILGYQVSYIRAVEPCILAMCMLCVCYVYAF